MTKRHKTPKKLRLSTETVRRMNNDELRLVAGGPEADPIAAPIKAVTVSCWGFCNEQ